MLRAIVGDDVRQAETARDVLAEPALLPLTVTLECEWVLRSWYKLGRPVIRSAFLALFKTDGLLVEAEAHVCWALDRYAAGADFADMMHIVAGAEADRFSTFDRSVEKAAGTAAPLPVEVLPNS